MNVSTFIARRITFNQQKSFSRFIIRLSVTATIISVAVMIITLSFVNGFQKTVAEKVFSFWGHLRIGYLQPGKSQMAEEEPVDMNRALTAEVKRMPGVHSIHPFATKYAILKTTDNMGGVLLKGFDRTYDSAHIQPFMQEGRFIRFNDSTYSREVIISTITARALQLKLLDRVMLFFVRPDGKLRPDKLTIVGIYKTSIEEYDRNFAIGDLQLIQRLNNWKPTEIGGYEVFLTDYKNADSVSNAVHASDNFPPTWQSKTAKQLYPNIFDWLNVQDTNQGILITIMVIIAAINLITCLLILVLERLRMVGILKALGAEDWEVQKIFLYQSGIITAAGITLGALFGLGILFLQMHTGFIRLDEDAYFMRTAAVEIRWWQVAAVCLGTLILSVLILLVPSVLVKKIQPIKAIRFR